MRKRLVKKLLRRYPISDYTCGFQPIRDSMITDFFDPMFDDLLASMGLPRDTPREWTFGDGAIAKVCVQCPGTMTSFSCVVEV